METIKGKKCKKCKEDLTIGNLWDIETPNYMFDLCVNCAIDVEDIINDFVTDNKE